MKAWITMFLIALVIVLSAARAECVFCVVPVCWGVNDCGAGCSCYIPAGETEGFCYARD